MSSWVIEAALLRMNATGQLHNRSSARCSKTLGRELRFELALSSHTTSHNLRYQHPDFFCSILLPASSKPNPIFCVEQQPEMGTGKKEAQRKIRQGKVGDGMGNVKVKGENFYR
jgi:hypothetical protein